MKKRFTVSAIAIFLFISGAIFLLAIRANVELERIVSQQFQEQQLILTHKISDDILKTFHMLDAALLSFSRLQVTADALTRHEKRSVMETFEFLHNWGVLGIGFVHPDLPDELTVYTKAGWMPFQELNIELPDQPVTSDTSEAGIFSRETTLSRTHQPHSGPFAGRWIMIMAHELVTTQHTPTTPKTPQSFLFILDAQSIAKHAAEGVRSGKTGYAWVIDHQGFFMYHVEPDFDGQNSFIIRHERNPNISYERINNLVQHRLLKGEEGTDWYISGWHWEVIREMKKLIAFSPIILARENGTPTHVWSVGLAAPDTEVYGLIQPMFVRQWLIVGLFFAAVMTTFGVFLFISLRWSEVLRREVDKKTEHLRHSENALRQERDKVTESMDQLLRTQERLLTSERLAAIGEAAAHLSHEIKNPLMLMGGFARQVQRSLPEDDDRREKLEIIVNEAKRLELLLLDVRDFTRPPQPQLTETDLNHLVLEVVDLFQEQYATHNIERQLILDPAMPKCMLDANQIKQVLLNLVKNAVEAMPDGGKLNIISSVENDMARIIVADTGTGMTQEVLKKLFHPFFSTKAKGTGLGLAVCYKVIQDHGGEITVQSLLGHGSRFSVHLPLSQPPK
jgi:two-component system, NtrC family, sensor histidine kinase HydH